MDMSCILLTTCLIMAVRGGHLHAPAESIVGGGSAEHGPKPYARKERVLGV